MEFKREVLEVKTAKELLEIAKDLQIKGRHDMKKADLVYAVLAEQVKNRVREKNADFDSFTNITLEDVVRGTLITKEEAEIVMCKAGPTEIVFSDNGDDLEAMLAMDLGELDESWDAEEEPQFAPGSILTKASNATKPTESDSAKQKQYYLDNAKIGVFVAFRVNSTKTLSGKIEEIHKADFVIETKNGVRFTIKKSAVIWVKSGSRWPRGVFLELKGVANNVQD